MAKAPKQEIDVLSSLKFISKAQREAGNINQTHCRVSNGQLIACDDILACGMPLKTPLPETCPNTFQFIHALERAKDVSDITFENTTITVKTAKFKAIVPCVAPGDLVYIAPDPYGWPLSDAFMSSAVKAAIFTREGAMTVAGASILTSNGTLIGTDGHALIEVYHGNPTPPGLIIPKSFIDAMTKTAKKIVGFGYSETSFTVWYEDQSWIKTQLYSEQWPNISGIMAYTETANNIQEASKDFWDGLQAVHAFAEAGAIYFEEGGFICSHADKGKGAEYRVKELPAKQSYNYKNLLKLQGIANRFDWTCNENMAIFFGENIRGAISKMRY